MKKLKIKEGEKVLYGDKPCVITKINRIDEVSIEEVYTGIPHTLNPKELEPIPIVFEEDDFLTLTDKEWSEALKCFNIIKPLVQKNGEKISGQQIADEHGIGKSTVYRMLNKFEETGLISSLVKSRNNGGKGKPRTSKLQEEIIQKNINKEYLGSKRTRSSIKKTINAVKLECNSLGIKAPSDRTIRRRIDILDKEEVLRKRHGKKASDEKYGPILGSFPGAHYPLSVVQIDHTRVDLILVDEQERKPLKRPWLTLAMDVYSRMVVGFYLSFDPPSFLSVGICLAHSILPKDKWLEKVNVKADWPCWGIMDVVHTDNGKDFRSKNMERACENYGIKLKFRPRGKPHYGGHVERLLGTFMKKVHDLPGATFSNIKEKKEYDSAKNASYTLKEFEQYLTILITNIYHQEIHSEIATTPINKFHKGFMDENNKVIRKVPDRIADERKVKLDFLPTEERSVQRFGVRIDNIKYYANCLRPYILDTDPETKKLRLHIFKRDPRDISKIYFYDPNLKRYFEIPYRNAALPPISLWEYREIKRILKEKGVKPDEEKIFSAWRQIYEMEDKVVKDTLDRRKNSIHKEVEENDTDEDNTDRNFNDEDIEPYDEIES